MKIGIIDTTLREGSIRQVSALSFREKIEIAKYLDALGVDVIETAPIEDIKTDSLALKTIGALMKNAVLSCDVGHTRESIDLTWAALSKVDRVRLLISLPVSAVQMEYILHKKADGMLDLIKECVSYAASLCPDVEFAALDATRAQSDFLASAVCTAVAAGAKNVTICDTAGICAPDDIEKLINDLKAAAPSVDGISLAVETSNALDMAAACALAAVTAGASAFKTAVGSDNSLSLSSAARMFRAKGPEYDISCSLVMTNAERTISRIRKFTSPERGGNSPFDSTAGNTERATILLDDMADEDDIRRAALTLGYDLSEEDIASVYEGFKRVAVKKKVGAKELDAIIASASLQVPVTYKLESYVINSGNRIGATALITIEKNGRFEKAVCAGDGPIDASFLAIEQLIGRRYELEAFEIQAVTEGTEAVGDALVKLRSGGKLYVGRGISTDIIGASVRAYLNAVNKIVYEEGEQ